MTNMLRGDRALALGAIAAGVQVVTGYPGSPATSVFDAISQSAPDSVQAHWAPNEKVAMELAYGASLAGRRALVVVKSVGMNVALDALATVAMTGCHAGLVIALGDDPGAWGSQNEQDTRWVARVAEIPLVEPLGVRHAAALMAQAYTWSESVSTPVIVRFVRALTEAEGEIEPPWELPPYVGGFYRKRGRWITLPSVAVAQRRSQHRRLRQVRELFEVSPYDLAQGGGRTGVVAVGYPHSKLLRTTVPSFPLSRVLGLTSAWPLPEKAIVRWLAPLSHVLVLEEGGPFVEEQLRGLAHRQRLQTVILGRHQRLVPEEGELTTDDIAWALERLAEAEEARNLPIVQRVVERVTVSDDPLCADCLYRPTFDALLRVMSDGEGRNHYLVVGEAGCMVRANQSPYELFDVKYALGSALGLSIGLGLGAGTRRLVTLLGDSSFFHSGINALPQALELGVPMALIVLDNGVTGLTGGQQHPGSPGRSRAIDIIQVMRGYGLEPRECDARDLATLEEALRNTLDASNLQVLVVHCPCSQFVADAGECP